MRLRFVGDERLIELTREGNRAAFEAIYDRHAAALLSFCVYMLGSHHDAEDAVQATFASAHKALLKDDRELVLRPWLFVIARNACVSLMRKRRSWVELNGEPALDGDPVRSVEAKQDVRSLVDGLLELPEPQRAALVLSEVHGLSQQEISTVMGVRPAQVKAYAYQARSNLIAERSAREADCAEIREALSAAHGHGRLKSQLRRHVRSCDNCREFQRELRHQSHALGLLFPIVPTLALKARALHDTLENAAASAMDFRGGAAVGGGAAGTAALAGGGVKAIFAVVAGVACVGACGVGVSLLGVSGAREKTTSTSSSSSTDSQADPDNSSDVARVGGPAGLSRSSAAGGAAKLDASERAKRTRARTLRDPQGGPKAGGGPESAILPGRTPGHRGSADTNPAPSPRERNTGTPAERAQKTAEREHAANERREKRAAEHTPGGENHGNSSEENAKRREQQKREREQQKQEREEQARSLHGLPPELRKAEREKREAEREQRRAEDEEHPTK